MAHVVVTGAASDDEAHRAARKVADSALVKCSLNGEDPYWGRVVSELGSAGRGLRPRPGRGRLRRRRRCAGTAWPSPTTPAAVRAHMAGRAIEIALRPRARAGDGPSVLTSDLGHGYIDENRTTS